MRVDSLADVQEHAGGVFALKYIVLIANIQQVQTIRYLADFISLFSGFANLAQGGDNQYKDPMNKNKD